MFIWYPPVEDFPGGSDGKESSCNVGNLGLIPRSGRFLEKGREAHFSILAWRIPWTEEPGRLQSMRWQRLIFHFSCRMDQRQTVKATHKDQEEVIMPSQTISNWCRGISLVVQWLRLCASTEGGVGLISGWWTRSLHAVKHGQKTKNKTSWCQNDAEFIRDFTTTKE